MKSFQMKALALATLGLGGLVMAGSAFAACPTITQPAVSGSPGGGGAWSSQFITGTIPAYMDIDSTGGLNGTSCSLKVSLSSSSNGAALVRDSSPNDEQRIRVRFYVDFNALITGGFAVSNQSVTLHRMNDTTAPFSSDQLVVKVTGGATPTVRFVVSDINPGSHVTQVAIPLPTSANNQYRIEYDMQLGSGSTTSVPGLPALPAGCTAMPAAGNACIRMWVTAAGSASLDTAPDASITFNGTGYSGAKTSNLGLQSGSPQYRANHAGTVIRFDEYDSRRQTFIGQ